MYSGTTLTRFSGRILGGHQKLDRLARSDLQQIIPDNKVFPSIRQILHFEGRKGPDAIKRKSPAKDEPWHYFDPFDRDDNHLTGLINDHYKQLVLELRAGNQERAAFEAAWLAHSLIDGLTPPHHFPYEAELERIWGSDLSTRTTIRKKWFPPAENVSQKLQKTWQVWGPSGIISAHTLFELGAAVTLVPLKVSEAVPQDVDRQRVLEVGVVDYFKQSAQDIAVLDIYRRYLKRGWTTKLLYDIRKKLVPIMVRTVTLTWYAALVEAGLLENSKSQINTKSQEPKRFEFGSFEHWSLFVFGIWCLGLTLFVCSCGLLLVT